MLHSEFTNTEKCDLGSEISFLELLHGTIPSKWKLN